MIQANIDARNSFTNKLAPPPKPALSAYEAQDALFGIAYKQPGMATLADCKEVLGQIISKYGSVHADAVLSRFGLWKLNDMFMGRYQDFFLYCQSVLVFGANPFYGWTLNAITDKVRNRWLLWHPESDCLFESKVAPTEQECAEGIADVTGILEYEQRFLADNRRYLDPKEEEL